MEATAVVPEGRISPEDAVHIFTIFKGSSIEFLFFHRDFGRTAKLNLSKELSISLMLMEQKLGSNLLMLAARLRPTLPGYATTLAEIPHLRMKMGGQILVRFCIWIGSLGKF